MSRGRSSHLDALEARLTGPKRIALFGHRNVGKTTLLAVLYRQAAGGQLPGLRLAAADAHSAEYLAEKIAQIESGHSTAGTLAETELKLRLYHGPARLELIVKDYQGEHVTLGSQEPIQEFFADCDAVLLCLDPEGTTDPVERRRRQQEIEGLLERYIDGSDDLSAGRPIALLLTKFDRVLAEASARALATSGFDPVAAPVLAGPLVERMVDEQYGMTRHALRQHAPDGAIFAVSAYGPGADGNRPPTELHPMGLEGPLAWLAERIEAVDRAAMDELWGLATIDDQTRLRRCVTAYERHYPQSNGTSEYRSRMAGLERRGRRRRLGRMVFGSILLVSLLAGYDYWGFQQAVAFERDTSNPATLVADRWSALLPSHPTLPLFWPSLSRQARLKRAEWTVKAADVQVSTGSVVPDMQAKLEAVKEQAPQLAPAIRKVEQARELVRHEERWKLVYAEALSLSALEDPSKPLAAIDAFLREFPDTPRREQAIALARPLKAELAAKRSAEDRRAIDELARAENLPEASLSDLIEKARQFLAQHPDSPYRDEVQQRIDDYVRRLDERDIERARDYSRRYPTNFPTRIERFQEYLRSHQAGGRFLSEAMEARERIRREWDTYDYSQAYDHFVAHPEDIAEVARRLREYQRAHPDGHYSGEARTYLDWWDKVSVAGEYRVTLRRGQVEPKVGKFFSGGGPDLGVVVEVAGVVHGPSPVIKDNRRPIWDYTFPRPIIWKLGDPITVRIIDYDWSATEVYSLNSPKGDPLAMRILSGTIKSSKGGATSLVFSSDFTIPTLARPE